MASSGRSARADSEDDVRYRKALTGSTKSDSSAGQLSSKHGILPIYDSTDSLDSRQSFTAMRLRHRSSLFDGTTRFPKLTECAHFHYDFVELADVKVCVGEDLDENYQHKNGEHTEPPENHFTLQVTSASKTWSIRRTYDNFRQLDRQLHKCIYDRKFSHLPELQREWGQARNNGEFLHGLLSQYLGRLSDIAGSMINCGPILNWFELDNRGNHLLAVDDSGINTPAIAAAHAVKRYTAQAADEISLEVGDIVSVIDMPPPEDTIWWRGKRGFEVGFFPSGCVEVIGDKVPQSMASRIPEPPQKAVLRKHGKLITFFRTFFSNRPTRNELKQSGIVKERVFSCDLGEHLLNSGHDVPLVLKCCADVIENHGIVDGIYRLSGIASNIQKLRLAFDEDRAPDLTSETYLQDIHSISSLLKMYFRELPNPLLTYQLYDKFAEAVRDEDNKLLKIHDVVQQLPPPHYRTTQYLMRHLARVAANGHLTGMHSKNLAIVWAPNLLRSKELEIGGGAAALQGVGIQAVVTEFLICYADLIFSDRIPAYSSPDTNRSQKKPRPKSLAISTPTRLLSLEEARERALTTAIHPPQKFIDVGGGPENLPAKYHTVLDLPGYKKKLKDNKEPVKQKKSPVGGWKSFFSKSRSSSLKVGKGRKSSVPDPLTLGEQKAITEEDVHNWKRRRLRTAKSVESLTSSRGSRFFEFGSFDLSSPGPGSTGVIHKRGSSSSRSRSQSLDRNMFGSCSSRETVKEMAIDIGPSPRLGSTKQGHDKENTSPNQCPLEKKTSFIRGDSTRRAVFHRKTASAPSNQLQLEDSPPPPEAKRSTQPFESSSVRRKKSEKNKGPVESHLEISVPVGEVTITRELADKFVLRVDSKEIFRPPDQFDKPPDGRSSLRGDKKGKGKKKSKGDKLREGETVCTVDLQESPSARRKLSEESHGSPTRRDQVMETDDKPYFSRFHDYAEILEDQQEIDKHEARIRDELKAVGQGETSADVSLEPSQTLSEAVLNVTESDSSREHSDSSVDQLMFDVSQFEQSFHEPPAEYSNPRMSKSLSIPSDIQRSLDNVNLDSQSDLMSSVTISELSQSVDSFNVGLSDSEGEGSLWRSTSLGGDQESPLGRTLREINAQIDKAFQSDPSTPNEQLYMYPVDENLCFTIPDVPTVDTTSMLQQSVFEDYEEEEVATPTNESHFDFESVTKAPDSVPRSTFSTVSPATVSLADSTHKPHLSTVEVPSKTSFHQTAGAQDYREATIQGPPPAVGHDSNPLRPLPDVCLSNNQVKAPEADKSTVSSLEMAKRQLDADFVEIDPRMRESQLTEGEYVQLEDEDYVRLQQDARLTDESVNKTSKSRQNGSAKTVHKSDSAQSSSSMETIDTHVSGSPSVDLSLPLSASDEKFWQNTEFPALSPLSEVIEAYCCNLKTEGKACEIHDKCQSSGSSEQMSPEGFPEFDTTLRIDESVEELHIETDPIVSGVVCGQHSPAMVQIQLPSDTPSEPAEVEDETEPDVQVSYQIDFRKSGGFDILPEETPSYQEISTECFIVSPPETPVLELPPSLTNSVEMQPTSLQSEDRIVVEERKQIQKPSANDTCGENIDKQTTSNVSTPVSVEDWYSQMLQHGLRQTPDSDMDKLETVLMNQKDVSEPSSGSGKRPYDTMVEEQKYVDSLVAQLALGLPAAPTDANTSPVKKLKDGSHEDVGQTPKDLHLPPHVDMIPGEFRSQFNKSPKEHIRQSSGPRNKQIAPPKHDELITVRQKVTKLKKSPKSPPSIAGLGSSEIISVQEVSSDLGNAKLIVERRAIDKKKVQTVHATKVEQPLKQHAESLDSLSVVGGGQGELKCSKSHESLGVRSRDRTDLPQRMTNSACEPLSGCLDLTSPDTMSTSLTSSTDTFVSGMTDSADFSDFYMGQHSDGQALSLTGSGYLVKPTAEDAFLVQKAASLPNVGSWSPPLDGQTHSLPRSSASSRSSKLQSLKELFEPSSLENASGIVKSESQSGRPSPQCVPAESYDHSSTRQSRGQSPRVTFKDSPPRSQEFDPVNWQVSGLYETQDQNFPPDTTGLRKPKWTHQEQDGVLADCSEQGVEFTRNRVRISDPPISPSGKPPIHRHSNIRSRTHSDSALEDTNTSDLELCAEFTGDLSTGSLDRDHSKKSNLQRKGSIRELVAVFEKQGDSGLSSDSRTDSRGSLPAELTASREGLDQGVTSSGKSREFSPAPREPSRGRSPGPTDFSRAQSVRLGPKPFYGSK